MARGVARVVADCWGVVYVCGESGGVCGGGGGVEDVSMDCGEAEVEKEGWRCGCMISVISVFCKWSFRSEVYIWTFLSSASTRYNLHLTEAEKKSLL